MAEDFDLLSAGFLLQASMNRSYRTQVREIVKTLAQFLQDNGLVTNEILPAGAEINETFVIRRSDLTEEGFEFYRQVEQRWLKAIDRGVSPSDTTILERTLRAIRARI